MTNFEKTQITANGMALIAKEGINITFTKAEMGCGIYEAGENVESMTQLRNKVQEAEISSVSRISDVVSVVKFVITNKNLDSAYLLTELGVYAADGSGNEVLYAVCYAAPGNAQKVLPYNGVFASKIDVALNIQLSADSMVTVKDEFFASAEEVDKLRAAVVKHKEDKENPHGVTKEQTGLGEADNIPDKDKIVAKAKALDVSSPVGSETEPVYVDADGQVKPCSYTLGEAAEKEVADNLTTASPGTHLLDAYQGKLLSDRIAKQAIQKYTKIKGTVDITVPTSSNSNIYYSSPEWRTEINTVGCPADGRALVFCQIINTGSDSSITNLRGVFVDAYHGFKTLAAFGADGATHVAFMETATLYPSTTFYIGFNGSAGNKVKVTYSYIVIML